MRHAHSVWSQSSSFNKELAVSSWDGSQCVLAGLRTMIGFFVLSIYYWTLRWIHPLRWWASGSTPTVSSAAGQQQRGKLFVGVWVTVKQVCV